jgi:hypothetical protein
MELVDNLTAIAVVIGIVNGVILFHEARDRFYYFLLALVVGLGLGFFGYFGLTPETGIIIALASSGLYKTATRIGSH